MKKFLLIISIVMNLFSSSVTATSFTAEMVSTDKMPSLKILSWNIYMLPYISLFNNNGRRAFKIGETLHDSDYQIIVFQEAFSSKCRRIIAKALSRNFPYQYGPANKNYQPFRTNSGLWVVSKIPLTELGQIQFSVARGFDAVARKGAVLFEGYYFGSPFQLLATHLQADNDPRLREFQCHEIREHLLNLFSQKDVPQFICGDFNIDMDDHFHYTKLLQNLDAENGEMSGNVQVTYDEIDNNLAYVSNGRKRVLDYVLIRNSHLIRKTERRVQTFLSRIGQIETHLSDHYAMEFCVNFIPNTDSSSLSTR